jgi:hypothetical protein
MTALAQTRGNFSRDLFHGRGFHSITVAASLCEAQSTGRSAPKGAAQLQPGATPQEQYVTIPSAEGAIQTHV